jgi:hypothetical protein
MDILSHDACKSLAAISSLGTGSSREVEIINNHFSVHDDCASGTYRIDDAEVLDILSEFSMSPVKGGSFQKPADFVQSQVAEKETARLGLQKLRMIFDESLRSCK